MAILASDGSQASVNSLVASANPGDTITIPAGTFSWTGTTTITKAITLRGVNPGQPGNTAPESSYPTIIQNNNVGSDMISCVAPTNGHITIAYICFKQIANNAGSGSAFCLDLDRSDFNGVSLVATPYTCIVHDCFFDCGTVIHYMIAFQANGCLVYQCTCIGQGWIQLQMSKYNDTASWNTADTYGTQDTTGVGNCYVETCTIGTNAAGGGQYTANVDDNARLVFRNSVFTDCSLGSHGQESSPYGARLWEFYNNTFHCSSGNPQNLQNWFTDRGGAGVMWGNAMDAIQFKTGITFDVFSTSNSQQIALQTAWPAARQCGQGWSASSSNTYGNPPVVGGPPNGINDGTGQVTTGIYIWNNTGSSQGSTFINYGTSNDNTFIQINRDYFASAKPGYTPFPYPHPLTQLQAATAVPALVNHVATGMANTPVTTLTTRFPDPVLAGNCLVCFVQCSTAGSITSVKDNLGNTFTLATSFTSTAFSKLAACYVLPNATAGVTYVQVTYSGLSTNNGGFGNGLPQMDISQWYNVATVSPLDVVASSNSSKSLTMATATSGDLVLYWAIDLSDNTNGGAFNGTSITSGTGFTLLTADRQLGSVVQYQVQGTAGSISPTCATSGSATWGSMAIALKAATAGTAPSSTAMRIVSQYHCSFSGNNSVLNSSFNPEAVINNIQFPCQGNLLVGSYQAEGAISAITSTGNTWTLPASANITSSINNQTSQIVYAAGLTPSPTLSANFTFTNGNVNTTYGLIVLYDIVNAAASPFASGNTAQGQSTTFASVAMPSVTPAIPGGIVFSMMCISWDTVNACNLSGAILDCIVNNLESNNTGTAGTQASPLDEDAGIAHLYNSNTAAVTFTYGANTSGEAGGGNPGPGSWSSAIAAFSPPSTGPSSSKITATLSAGLTGAGGLTGSSRVVRKVSAGLK